MKGTICIIYACMKLGFWKVVLFFGWEKQVKRMREEYGKLDKTEMSIWECCEMLNEVVDDSDPDLDEPQIQHLLQSAEAIRKDYPDEDWLHLTALIHGTSSLSFFLLLFNSQ